MNIRRLVSGKIRAWVFVVLIVGPLFVSVASVSADEGTLFEDDFGELNLNNWSPFGFPSPRVLASVEGRTGVFDNNGDSWCDSGAVSIDTFPLSNGFTMESDVFVRVTNMAGCWDAVVIGLTKENTPYWDHPNCPGEGYYTGLAFGIVYVGDACWAAPSEKRRHAYFRISLYNEDGVGEGPGGYEKNADDYLNGWHNLKIVVGEDRFVSFYCDDIFIYKSEKRIHEDILLNKKIYLGQRSCGGSAGKAYHDNIKVHTGGSNDGLVAEWHFDEGSGTTVTDSSGNGNDGAIQGATWTTGVSGTALEFDGVEDYVEVPHDPSISFSGTDNFAFAAWFKTDSDSEYEVIINKNPATVAYDPGYRMSVSSGYLDLELEDSSHGPHWKGTTIVNDGKWHYGAMVINWSADEAYIYVDGKLDGTADISGIGDISNTANLGIGTRVGKVYAGCFNGIIDEVAIYSRTLTADEIKTHYEEEKPVCFKWTEVTEYKNANNDDFTLYSLDYSCNPISSDYMVVVSPLLAQAFVAEEYGDQDKIDAKKGKIEAALRAVLNTYPDASIYIIDKDLELSESEYPDELRNVVYGLPLMERGGNVWYDFGSTVKRYGDLKQEEYRQNIWKLYSNWIKYTIKKNKPKYVLILGSPYEFPEYYKRVGFRWGRTIESWPFVVDVFSDSDYAEIYTFQTGTIYEIPKIDIYPIGRISIGAADSYFAANRDPGTRLSNYDKSDGASVTGVDKSTLSRNTVKNCFKPLLDMLENKGYPHEKNYYCVVPENSAEPCQCDGAPCYTIDASGYPIVFLGWHGSITGISSGSGGMDRLVTNPHPMVLTGFTCLIGNEGGYYVRNSDIIYQEDSFAGPILNAGATIMGNTNLGFQNTVSGDSLSVSNWFVQQVISGQSDTVGDAWISTIKEFKGYYIYEDYCAEEFRLLGDPALDITTLDDPASCNVTHLPEDFMISLVLEYNRTTWMNTSQVNVSITSIDMPTINGSEIEARQYAEGSGSPAVPAIYIAIPMPSNQTIENAVVNLTLSMEMTELNLLRNVVSFIIPNESGMIPGIERHGSYPEVYCTTTLFGTTEENYLKMTVFPLKYNIDNQSAVAYQHVNISIETLPFVEETINASVRIDPLPESLTLQEGENETLMLSVYNDIGATMNATNVSVVCEVPSDLTILSSDGNITDHNVSWNIRNLTTMGVDSLKFVQLTIKAPDNIVNTKNEQLNISATYSDPFDQFYGPTKLSVPVPLISPTYVDLKVANISVPDIVIAGEQVKITGVIQNVGDMGLTNVPVVLSVDGNATDEQIIDKISSGANVTLNYCEQFNTTGMHTVEIAVQPISLEINITNNYVNKTITALQSGILPIITIKTGWNLISVPLNLTTWQLGEESVVGDSLNVTPNNSLISIYRYNTTTGRFDKCDHLADWGWWPATGTKNFTELEPGRGYWLWAKNNCLLTFTGTAASDRGISLDANWNLIGWYSTEEAILGEESVVGNPLNATPKNSLTSIYRYNSSTCLFDKCDHLDDWGWWPATGSESFTALEPGRGYWVWAENGCVWQHKV